MKTMMTMMMMMMMMTLFLCQALSFRGHEVMEQRIIKQSGQKVQSGADVTGTWVNELGSTMQIVQSEGGTLEGIYYNGAPGSEGVVPEILVGKLGTETNGPATFGFIVNFLSGKYTTAWSGIYYKNSPCENGDLLLTTWIMTTSTENCDEYWGAVNVGQDRFTRLSGKLENLKGGNH